MNPSGIRTPLFFAPGSMGNVFTHLGHLARCLGPEQPFYGLQETTGDPIKIESIAARFLAEVRTVQPAGPYLLGGLCHGSVVVFEMAQQLRALGQHVAFLALVEPGYWRSRGPEAYARLATKVLGQAPGRLGRYLRRASSAAGTGQSDYVRQKARLVANALATIRYEPRAYLGRLDLFLTAESLPRPDDGAAGWQRVARGSMHIHEIPGDHALLVGADEMPIDKASMRAVAQGIRACLDEILDTTVALPTSRSWMSGGL